MERTSRGKIWAMILELFSHYIVWLIVAFVVFIWYFYPDFTQNLGQTILFSTPSIVLIFGLIIALAGIHWRTKSDETTGITQYDITLTKTDFYLVDLLIYFGALAMLVVSFFAKENGVDTIDLIHALLFFVFANWLKQIFYKKIPKC
ncbi:MAG: hypothetical protein WC460_03075 [Patescibacteria group bacterium]